MEAAPHTQNRKGTTRTWAQSSKRRKGVPFTRIQSVKGNCTFCETIYPDLEISGCLSNTRIPWDSLSLTHTHTHRVLISIHGHLHGWGVQTITWASHLAWLSQKMRFPLVYKNILMITPIFQYLLCCRLYIQSHWVATVSLQGQQ